MKKIVSIILATFMTLSVSADSGKKFVCSNYNQGIVVSGTLYRKDNLAPVSSSSYFDQGATYSEESFISIDFKASSYVKYNFLASRYSFIGMSNGFGDYTIQILDVEPKNNDLGADFHDVLILDIDHEEGISVIIPGTTTTKKQIYKMDYKEDSSCQTVLTNLY